MKKSSKRKKDIIEHSKTMFVINQFSKCEHCPLRIYAKENETITYGVGNINSNIIIVLPTYDANADKDYNTILKLLLDTYKEHIGRNLLEDAYITRIVKCYKNSPYNLIDSAIPYCIHHVSYEIIKHQGKYVVFMGGTKTHIDLYHAKHNIHLYHKCAVTTYSPAVMYYDNRPTIKDNFIKQLKWISNQV